MKKLILAILLTMASYVNAGQMREIPIEMLNLDNLGRVQFINNALKATGLGWSQEGVKYRELQSIVIGGDESDSDYSGGYFFYFTTLLTRDFKEFRCHQYISNGSFGDQYTRPITCEEISE